MIQTPLKRDLFAGAPWIGMIEKLLAHYHSTFVWYFHPLRALQTESSILGLSSPCQGHLSHLKRPWQLAYSFPIFWPLDPARPPPIKGLKSLFLLKEACALKYHISSQVVNTSECECVTVLKQRITAILTSSVWKANKMAVREEQVWETDIRASVSVLPFINIRLMQVEDF